jgi:hypothetical protein
LLIGVMLLEVGNLVGRDLSNIDTGQKFWSTLQRDADIAGYLRSLPGTFRADINEDDVSYNFGDWYGIETYFAYLASAPVSLMRVMAEPRTRQLFGVRYYVAKTPARGAVRELYVSASTGIKVYEVSGPMPRTWVVHDVSQLARPADVAPRMADPTFDITRSTFLLENGVPPLDQCSGDQSRVVHQEPEFVAIQATLHCRGMVILGDAYSKDWVATVDGKRVPLYPAYTLLDGVVAPAGEHRIELRYRPVSFYLGASLSVVALMLLIAMWFFMRRAERPEERRDSMERPDE